MTLSGPDAELAETPALESRMVPEILESRTSFSGPDVELAETLEVRLEVRWTLASTFASVLMGGVAPPVGDSVTELLEFSTSLKPSSLTLTLASLTVEEIWVTGLVLVGNALILDLGKHTKLV